MVCPKCGNKDNKKSVCSKCGYKIDTPIKVITFDDEEVVVDAPIITESHTFINEEEFQNALKERLEKEEQERKAKAKRKKHNIITIIVTTIIILIIALIAFIPNIYINNTKEKNTSQANEFSSTNWDNGEIKIDGVIYKLKEEYKKFVKHDWTVNLEYYGYENGYILNNGDKTSTTIQINNSKYPEAMAQVGFINASKDRADIIDCEIWSISINNNNSPSPIPFELPGGIKTGSTKEEIFAAYGELSEDKIYRSDYEGYTSYQYQSSYDNYLDLYVYDEKGLMEINLKSY